MSKKPAAVAPTPVFRPSPLAICYLRLEPVSGVGCNRLKYPNRQPLGITGPKGHLRKDLDELSRSTSRSIKVHFIFVVGGSQMTSKVQFFAETHLRCSQNDHSHTTPWYELVVFFGKLLGFRALFLGTPGEEKSVRRASPHP